ncbi:MAG: hybrid sensor histidine kinase/response regulator [Fluviicoccus sp.]|uniref:hybrid sensor histidine kinase/response regulator n=1 Tax=Fluviicoccus sp. TaxID=2003552 RepID=UPI00271762B3|nr:hybrid sensor histidine kinase/response regulator [Fluviicoccus sp.]MDO8329761.1 hybrid sensor histidine kinase/response regulator [Fluviicoccus sp.]
MANALNPEFMAQLVQMFRAELEENLQSLTDGLIALERLKGGEERQTCVDNLFRDAHNIKGAARGVNVSNVELIAHGLESMLSAVRQGLLEPDSRMIDLCLQGVDGMKEAMDAFMPFRPLEFDLQALLDRLNHWQDSLTSEAGKEAQPVVEASQPEEPAIRAEPPAVAAAVIATARDPGLTRIAMHRLDSASALVEELMATKIEMEDHFLEVQQLLEAANASARLLARLGSGMMQQSSVNTALLRDVYPLDAAAATLADFRKDSQRIFKKMRAGNNRLGLISGNLQDQVRMMRMVPVSTLLLPMARTVRDLALELGKQVNYEVIGEEFEMDRPLLEGVKDPLMHLLRNSIDHGIEKSGQRLRQGKESAGRLCISVRGEGSRILMTVEDDGAGISLKKVAEAAVRKRLLSAAEAQALSPADTLNLIFRPGFSSNEIITNVSGRGVGLDVVLSNIRKLKGTVQVESEEGRGTRFTIALPLSMSIDRGLMVRVGSECYVLPSTSVVRVMEVAARELVNVGGRQAIRFQGKAVPVCELAAVLQNTAPDADRGRLLAVVVEKGWQMVAFMVDDIIGEREIVIKRFKPPLAAVRNVTGGTLMGSGKVLIVLNPAELVQSALQPGFPGRIHARDAASVSAPHILVADDSITTRSLEKNILESHGYKVTTAIDGSLAWQALQGGDFDLVVTDAEMPEMNGFELVRRIRADARYGGIPVVMVTSLASEADKQRGIDAGADAYIVKSQFETDTLLNIINQLI